MVKRKFPGKEETADAFLTKLSYELVYTPHQMPGNLFEIRDEKDYPVVYSAVIDETDILISGDKDIKRFFCRFIGTLAIEDFKTWIKNQTMAG